MTKEEKNLHVVKISGYAHDGAGVGRIPLTDLSNTNIIHNSKFMNY